MVHKKEYFFTKRYVFSRKANGSSFITISKWCELVVCMLSAVYRTIDIYQSFYDNIFLASDNYKMIEIRSFTCHFLTIEMRKTKVHENESARKIFFKSCKSYLLSGFMFCSRNRSFFKIFNQNINIMIMKII